MTIASGNLLIAGCGLPGFLTDNCDFDFEYQ